MYLPGEFDPHDEPLFLIVVPIRATGAREVTCITTDPEHAVNMARISHGYVLEINRTDDHR